MLVIKFNAKHGPGQDYLHGSFQFDGLFFQNNIAESGDPDSAAKSQVAG